MAKYLPAKILRILPLAVTGLFCVMATDARAQFTFASDSAQNYGGAGEPGWTNVSDAGTGFGGWGFTDASASTGSFIGNPTNNGIANTNMGTEAFGMFANSSTGGYANRSRGFDVGLTIGDSFSFDWGMNWDSGNAGGSKGFDLRADGTTIFNVNNGNSSALTTTGSGTADSSFGTNNMRVTLTRTSSGYTFTMVRRSDGTTFSTNISSSATINNFNFYIGNQQDGNGNRNIYFDNLSITNSGVFSSGGTVTNANTFAGSGALSIGASTTLILSGGGNNNYSGATTISNGSTLIFAGSGTSQFASTIGGGTGNVVMSNSSGLVVLNNNNTYTGNTTVAAGRLLIGNASALGSTGTLTVGTGGQLQLSNGITMSRGITLSGDGVGSTGALLNVNGSNIWSGDITNASGTRINAESGTTLTIGGNIVNSGGGQNFYVGGAGNVTINGTLDGTATTGNGALYKDGSGVLTLTNNNSGLTGLVRLLGGTISITNNNSLGSGVLELGGLGTQAILSVGTNTTRSQNLLIQNSSTNSVVNVASGSAFTVTGSLTQDGTPANTTKFGKDGSGTLVLAGASGNTYNGQIQIGNGTVIAGTSTALGTNASTTARGIDLGLNITDASQANNVALRASNGVTVGQSIYVAPNTGNALRTIGLAGSGSATFNNEIFLDGTLTVDAGAAGGDLVTISGAINNTGGLTKTGAGMLLLSGNNGYTGATTINAGTLRLGGDNRISSQSAIDIASGATLDMNGFSDTLGALSGSGAVTLGLGTLTTSANAETTYSGAISGTGSFVKSGTGTTVLSGNSSYSGSTTVGQGVLVAASANALGVSGGTTTVNTGGALYLSNATSMTVAENMTINSDGISGAGALRNIAGDNTISGNITLGSGARINSSTAGSLAIQGSISGGTNVLYIGGSRNMTISGAISGAGAAQDGTITSLYKDSPGVLTLSGNNTFSGDTRITNGSITVASGGNLGNGTSDVYISAAGSLTVNANATIASIREWGTTNGGTATIGSGATLTVGGNDWFDYMNSIGGAGNLVKSGTGTMNLYGTQSYTGTTTVSGGRLSTGVALGSSGVTVSGGTFETTQANILGDTATVTVNSGTYSVGGNDTIGALSGTGGTISLSNNRLTTTVASGSSSYTGGTITGAGGGITKAGAGTLSLGGTHTYTGATTVEAGELRMMGVLSSSSLLNVNAGATLSGTGTIGGAATISGIHSPGTSPGIQTFSSGLTYNAGSTNVWELTSNTSSPAARGSSYDGVNLGSGANLTFAGTTKMSLVFNSAGSSVNWTDTFWSSDKSWLVYDLNGGSISGTNNFSVDSINWVDSGGRSFSQFLPGSSFSVSISGQDLNLIYTIPEPSTYALLALSGIALGFYAYRRRRRPML